MKDERNQELANEQMAKVGLKVISIGLVGLLLVAVVMFLWKIDIPPPIAKLISYQQEDTERYYVFPEGLTPVIHTFEYSFWLCQNEAGEYLECSPVIESRPVTQAGEGETDE